MTTVLVAPMEDEITSQSSAQSQRERLVRLCTWQTGDRDAAEDIVQEALVVAWQQSHRLRDHTKHPQWLAGIARNLCLHWKRQRGRECAQFTAVSPDDYPDVPANSSNQADAVDIEVELERHELATLLDRALALLPSLTRTVLIERYIHESPQAEIAQRLGTTEGAVEARIQRGKLTLRRVLVTDHKDEAAAYGLSDESEDSYRQTRIRCPNCGQRFLNGCFVIDGQGSLQLHCPGCDANTAMGDVPGLFDGVHGYRAALSRLVKWCQRYFLDGLTRGYVACPRCGQPIRLQLHTTSELSPHDDPPGFQATCTACRTWATQADISAIAFCLPETQHFWREHPRMTALPVDRVEAGGSPAFVLRFRDVASAARLDVILSGRTLMPLNVHHS